MPVLTLKSFSGVAPRFTAAKLAPNMAQVASNVRLLASSLDAWRQPLSVKTGLTAADTSTIYRMGQDLISDTQYWLHWTTDVDVAKGAIADDQTERTYFAHPSLGLRQTNNSAALTDGSGDYPWGSFPVGVPAPASAPIASVLTQGDEEDIDEVRFYVCTFVTQFGEEGPPSPASSALTVKPSGATVRLSNLPGSAPSGYTDRYGRLVSADFTGHITAKRIYRTLSGLQATDFQLVDEIPIAQTQYDDSIASSDLSETLTSTEWLPPPAGATGVTQMANGIMVIFKGYDIYPSEAYQPYAFPNAYSLAMDYPYVGAASLGSSSVVLTTSHPYLLTGSDPSAMNLTKLDAPQACVSKRSITAADGGVAYASPDGLMFVTASGQVTNLTKNIFTRKEWQSLVPSSIDGYFHDGRYFGFYDAGGMRGGFIFEPQEGAGAFTFIDVFASAGFVDTLQDALYLKVGGEIVKWDAGSSPMTYRWKSAKFEQARPSNPACAQVVATQYPVTFKLIADDVTVHAQSVEDATPFWLPADFRARFLEVELSGAVEVLSVHVASSPMELATV